MTIDDALAEILRVVETATHTEAAPAHAGDEPARPEGRRLPPPRSMSSAAPASGRLARLYTPHRMAYIRGENKPAGGGLPVLRASRAARRRRAHRGPRRSCLRGAQPLPVQLRAT